MATKRYVDLLADMEKLQAEMKLARDAERPAVVASMQQHVKEFEIAPDEIFGAHPPMKPPVKLPVLGKITEAPVKRKHTAKANATAKRLQTAAKTALESFVKTKAAGKQPPRKSLANRVKYRIGDQTWSGFGRQPEWMTEALAAGKTREELRA